MKSLLVLSTLLIAGSASAAKSRSGFCKGNDYVSPDMIKKYCVTSSKGKVTMNYALLEQDYGISKSEANKKFHPFLFGVNDQEAAQNLRAFEAERKVKETIGSNNPNYIQLNSGLSKAEDEIAKSKETIKAYEAQQLDRSASTQQYQDKQAECNSLQGDYTKSQELATCNQELASLGQTLISLDESKEKIKAARVERARQNLALQEQVINKRKSQIESDKTKFNEAYKGRLFSSVQSQFDKAGKGFKNIDQAADFCYSDISEQDTQQLKDTCDNLITNISAANEFNKKVDAQLKELDDAKNPIKMLGLQLDNSLMNDKIAKAEILNKAKGKLKGTVMGALMDQMSSDMCNIAQNTEAMCPGAQNADLTSFVSNAVEAAKQADVIPDLPNLEDTSPGTFVESVPIGN